MTRWRCLLLPAALIALPAAAQQPADENTVLRGIASVRVITLLAGDAAERANCLDDAHLPAIHDAIVGSLVAAGVEVPQQRGLRRLHATTTALIPQPNDTSLPLLTVTIEQAGAMFAGTDVGCSYSMVATLGTVVRGGRVASTGTALPETRNSYIWLATGRNIGSPEEVRLRAVTTAPEISDRFINGLRAAGFVAPRREGAAGAGVQPNRAASAGVPPRPASAAPAHDCDRLAQPPRASMGRVPAFADGVGGSRPMDVPAARSACQRAMAEWPDEARFVAYAGSVAAAAAAIPGIPAEVSAREAREAVRLYRLAAARGSAVAEYELALFHRFGVGDLQRSDHEVLRYYTLSAEKGHGGALLALAQAHQGGNLGLPVNLPEAVRFFRLAAEVGERLSAVALADAYENGRLGLAVNPAEALRMLRLAAEAGFPPAQLRLGRMMEEGRGGVPRNSAEALRLYRLAAEAGNADARAAAERLAAAPPAADAGKPAVGTSLAQRSTPDAATTARPASSIPAQECDRLAQPSREDFGRLAVVAAGVRSIPGGGFPAAEAACRRAMAAWPNEPRFAAYLGRVLNEAGQEAAAHPLFHSAAERQDPYGTFALGVLSAYRRSAPVDEAAALRSWRIAAEMGFVRAQWQLGSALVSGVPGRTVNEAEGMRLVRLAAEGGYMPAQFQLAEALERGRNGVTRDEGEAIRFYGLAAAAGNGNAEAALRRLTGQPAPGRRTP